MIVPRNMIVPRHQQLWPEGARPGAIGALMYRVETRPFDLFEELDRPDAKMRTQSIIYVIQPTT